MSNKLIIAFVVVFALGICAGHFGGKTVQGTFDIEKKVDSLNVVNSVKDQVLKDLIKEKSKTIEYHTHQIKLRDEAFKKDTIIPSDDNLIERIRTINNGR